MSIENSVEENIKGILDATVPDIKDVAMAAYKKGHEDGVVAEKRRVKFELEQTRICAKIKDIVSEGHNINEQE